MASAGVVVAVVSGGASALGIAEEPAFWAWAIAVIAKNSEAVIKLKICLRVCMISPLLKSDCLAALPLSGQKLSISASRVANL